MHRVTTYLYRSLAGALLAAAVLAGVAQQAAAAPAPTEASYLAQADQVLERGTAASDDLQALLEQAGDDVYVIFDAAWQDDLGAACDEFDATYAQARRLRAPADYQWARKYLVASYKQMHLACADLRLFLVDYDAQHLTAASAHINRATGYMERVNAQYDRLGVGSDL